MFRKIALAALALTALAGCSVDAFTYTINEYGEVKGVRVRLGCHDAYEVFDRPTAGNLLVVTNGINEAMMSSCPGLTALPRPERMRKVAEIYLTETSTRPDCRITRETALTESHTEYTYRCQPVRAARSSPRRS